MSDIATTVQTGVVITTSAVTLITGFLLGLYVSRGYLIPPALREQRRRALKDPVESDESDVDEDESLLDHAPNWANGLEADRRDGLRMRGAGAQAQARRTGKDATVAVAAAADDGDDENEECKLVLVVRTDLGMGKGKVAAQCGHATLACYKSIAAQAQRSPDSAAARRLRSWERRGQAKIALQVGSEDKLMELMGLARSLGITAEVIADAGRTQIEAGSLTVLGVGPAPKSLVDRVTGELKLL